TKPWLYFKEFINHSFLVIWKDLRVNKYTTKIFYSLVIFSMILPGSFRIVPGMHNLEDIQVRTEIALANPDNQSLPYSRPEITRPEPRIGTRPSDIDTEVSTTSLADTKSSARPLLFVENVGQFDPNVKYQMMSGGNIVRFTKDSVWFTLFEPKEEEKEFQFQATATPTPVPPSDSQTNNDNPHIKKGVHIKLEFAGSNPDPMVEGFGPSNTVISYFLGDNPEKWKSNVPVWEGIRYKNIYPGTDLEITSIEGNWNWELKFTDESTFSSFNNPEGYDFIFNGQDQLEISDNNIILTTQVGSVVLPVMGVGTTECSANLLSDYVMIENRVNVYTSLAPENWETGSGLDGPSMNNVDPVGFSPTLVTETSSSFYSTFLGGSASETGFGITVDESGNAYVVGQTYSTDFPHTYGSFNGGHSDMFITKINQGGSDIYFSTFIGGSCSDCYSNCSIVVDENGESYIVGDTISLTFPTTETALDRTFNDGFNPYSSDGYVIKLNVLGDSLLYSSYLGGSSDDIGYGIDLYAGYIYVTGMTDSSNFPTTAGAYIMVKKPYQDIFVSKLDLSLSGFASLIYSTFVGGNSSDQGHDIDVLNGYAYVTGQTLSTDFPAVNAFDASHNGEWDSIIFKLNQSGTGLEYSTYLGGSSNDCEIAGNSQECSIAVDWNGYAYVTGLTLSSNFPTYHALDSTMGGTDAYIAKLNQNGNALIYSTFLGGSSSDVSNAIEVDDSGYTYIVGSTWSSDFPTTNGAFDQNYWNVEAFILKLPSDGSRVLYASFFGGSGDDFGYGLCLVDSMGIGGVIFTGSTSSSDFPLSTQAYDSSYSGSSDAFISKLFILNINSVPDSAIRTGCTVKNSVPECPKIATYDDSQGAAGDPINTRTGGFDYSVVGMSIPTSAGLLKFQRYYSSLSTEVFTDTLGYGWTHNLDSYLIFPADPLGEENKIIYKANSGNFYKFIDNSDGTFSAEPGVLITLTKVQVPTIHYQVVDTEQNVYTFDDIGRIVRREDPQGHYWSYIYTGEQLTQVVDDTNLKYLSLTYFPQGKLQSVVDHTGRGISFDYDLAGDLTLFVDTLNKETTYSYDNFHRLRIVTDPAQKVVVHNEYDIQGRSYQQFDPDGTLILTVNYDLSSTTITNSLNEVDTHNYDDRNTLVSISEEPGSDVNRTYDYNFRIIKEIDENDQPIRMTWSTYGANLRRVVDALENQTDLTYDDINNLTSIIDPRAYLTTFEYDGTLLTGETNALFETTIYTYTTSTDYPQPAGLLKAVQDPLGNVTHYAYDEFGQRTSITDASNQSTTFAYDLLGRLTKTTYHNGQTDWTCYDAADRIVRTVINATGDGSLPQSDPCDAVNYQSSPQPGYDRITTTVYDDSGNVIATIDTDGIINRTYYNADLRPATSIQNLVGQTIENPVPPPYDPLYPNQNIRTDTYYDSEGNVIAVEDTLGRITRTYYDSQNRPQYIVQNLTGQAIEVNTPPAYDPSYPDQNISSETVYDPVGNAIASIDTLSRITRTYYDELNRPKYVVQNLVGQDITIQTPPCYNPYYPDENILTEYVYDESGNTIAVIDTLGRIQRTYYDALNRP
ncbi:hypothetical protein EHM76_00620, partial [bacterium]